MWCSNCGVIVASDHVGHYARYRFSNWLSESLESFYPPVICL
jgi:hypothetical protein